MKILLPALLQLLAFGVAMAEIVVPSFGVLSVICLSLIGYSWYLIATELSGFWIWAFVAADMALLPPGILLGIRLMGRSPLAHRTAISQGTGREESESALLGLVGKTAHVEALLRPIGKIMLDGELYEATTLGEYLEKGVLTRVTGVQNGTLIVERHG